MSKQWGHGFHKGVERGQWWGEALKGGEWEIEMSRIGDRLTLISMALQQAASEPGPKTDVWWTLFASVVGKQVQDVAAELPGVLTGVVKGALPPDDEAPATPVQDAD